MTTNTRCRARALALVTAPVLLLVAHLLQPAHGTGTAEEVASQAANTGAYDASTVTGLVAMIAVIPAVLALSQLLGDRWSGLVGGFLALVGAVGLTFLLGTGVASTVIASEAGAQAVSLTDDLEGAMPFGVAVGLMLVGWTLGLITLAIGLGRAGLVPWWAAGCIIAATLVPAVAGGRVPVAAGFVLLLAGFAPAARQVLREDDDRVLVPA